MRGVKGAGVKGPLVDRYILAIMAVPSYTIGLNCLFYII